MIQITIYKNQEAYQEVKCIGHAEYDDSGKDIVCASVSVLVINSINAVEVLTEDAFTLDTNESTGLIDMTFTEPISHDGQLLMDALVLGLTEIQKQYGNTYFTLNIEEV